MVVSFKDRFNPKSKLFSTRVINFVALLLALNDFAKAIYAFSTLLSSAAKANCSTLFCNIRANSKALLSPPRANSTGFPSNFEISKLKRVETLFLIVNKFDSTLSKESSSPNLSFKISATNVLIGVTLKFERLGFKLFFNLPLNSLLPFLISNPPSDKRSRRPLKYDELANNSSLIAKLKLPSAPLFVFGSLSSSLPFPFTSKNTFASFSSPSIILPFIVLIVPLST